MSLKESRIHARGSVLCTTDAMSVHVVELAQTGSTFGVLIAFLIAAFLNVL